MQVMPSFVAVNLTSERYGGNIFSRKCCIKAGCLDIFPLVARLSITVYYKVIDGVMAIGSVYHNARMSNLILQQLYTIIIIV